MAVAVSGGADSVFLVHALRELYPARLSLVLHLNHGLRGAVSDGDAEWVAELAASLGLPVRTERVDLAAFDRNLEQAGRKARLALFRDVVASGAANRVATGHTRSDQAETVLYRLLRGTATTGLRGVLPVTAEGLIRPLLACERPHIEAWLRSRGIGWREDATNANPAFDRNRIRHRLLPLLKQEGWSQVSDKLARIAEVAADEELAWEERVRETAGDLLRRTGPAIVVSVRNLRAIDRALRRRLVLHVVRELKGDTRSISFDHVESVLALLDRASGDGSTCLPGVVVTRSFDWVRFDPGVRKWEWDCFVQSSHKLEVLELAEGSPQYNETCCALDADRLPPGAELRGWRAGDRFEGKQGRRARLKHYFQSARVPVWERVNWPVLAVGSAVIWAEGLGVAESYRVTERTRRILRVVAAEVSHRG